MSGMMRRKSLFSQLLRSSKLIRKTADAAKFRGVTFLTDQAGHRIAAADDN